MKRPEEVPEATSDRFWGVTEIWGSSRKMKENKINGINQIKTLPLSHADHAVRGAAGRRHLRQAPATIDSDKRHSFPGQQWACFHKLGLLAVSSTIGKIFLMLALEPGRPPLPHWRGAVLGVGGKKLLKETLFLPHATLISSLCCHYPGAPSAFSN